MSGRESIVAGLLAGILVAVLAVIGVVSLVPDPTLPTPSPPVAISPSPTAAPPSAAAASGSPGPSATGGPIVTAFHIGEPAPPLQVPQVGGGTIDLTNLRGKPVWVNFVGTYCPPCRDEFPLMNGFAARYASDGLVVIAVDVREDEGTVASFAQQLNATFPIGLDADGAAQRAWEAEALPVHFWIDAQGVIRDGALGGIGPDIMARGLKTILPGVDVKP